MRKVIADGVAPGAGLTTPVGAAATALVSEAGCAGWSTGAEAAEATGATEAATAGAEAGKDTVAAGAAAISTRVATPWFCHHNQAPAEAVATTNAPMPSHRPGRPVAGWAAGLPNATLAVPCRRADVAGAAAWAAVGAWASWRWSRSRNILLITLTACSGRGCATRCPKTVLWVAPRGAWATGDATRGAVAPRPACRWQPA